MITKVYRKMSAHSGGSFGSKSTSKSSSYGHRSGAKTYGGSKPHASASTHGGFSRGGYGVSRGGFAGSRIAQRGGGRRGPADQRIDPARFVNKAVITETVEKFVPEHAFNDFEIDARIKQNIAKHVQAQIFQQSL